MTTGVPLERRLIVTVIALTAAAWLLRGSLASALVTRGDDLLRSGDVPGALARYSRAIVIDDTASAAHDRLAFFLLVRRAPGDAQRAVEVANEGLVRHPNDASLLADRALANARLARWEPAEHDFRTVANISRSPIYAHFAARMSLRRHDRGAAIAELRDALRFDSAFAPSRALLRRLHG